MFARLVANRESGLSACGVVTGFWGASLAGSSQLLSSVLFAVVRKNVTQFLQGFHGVVVHALLLLAQRFAQCSCCIDNFVCVCDCWVCQVLVLEENCFRYPVGFGALHMYYVGSVVIWRRS